MDPRRTEGVMNGTLTKQGDPLNYQFFTKRVVRLAGQFRRIGDWELKQSMAWIDEMTGDWAKDPTAAVKRLKRWQSVYDQRKREYWLSGAEK